MGELATHFANMLTGRLVDQHFVHFILQKLDIHCQKIGQNTFCRRRAEQIEMRALTNKCDHYKLIKRKVTRGMQGKFGFFID